MKRTPLTRRTPLKRKTPLCPVSAKTKKERNAMALLRRLYKLAVGRCERCDFVPEDDDAEELLDVHEIPAGSSRHRAFRNPLCWLVLCRSCHDELQGVEFKTQVAVRDRSCREAINRALGRDEL